MHVKNSRLFVRNFRNRIIATWIAAILIPILVLFGYLAVVAGPQIWNYITNQENLNQNVWQLKKWNNDEFAFRYINSVLLDNPDKLLYDDTYKPIKNLKNIKQVDMIVLVRRGEEIKTINDFSSEEGVKVSNRFKNIENPVLPEFNNSYYTNNEELFDKTGYIVHRQLDFYFTDGMEGSVFFLIKVINIPSVIGKFIGNYFILLFVIILILVLVMILHSTHRFSKNFDEMARVINEVSHENFEHRLNLDVEPLSLLTEQLNNMIERLSDAKKYREIIESSKHEFITTMTHDIKTPLTSIRVQVEALKDGVVASPEKVTGYYVNIQKKLSEIDRMMNELQLFNDLETQIMEFDYKKVDLKYFFEDITEEWQYDPSYDKVEFSLNLEAKQTFFARIDPMKMKRIVTNLLSNSIKYANVQPLKFDISLRNKPGLIEVEIVDNGEGVSGEELEKVFEQYYRVDPSRNQQIPGSGLGLAICKSIVEKHGGLVLAFTPESGGFGIRILLPAIEQVD